MSVQAIVSQYMPLLLTVVGVFAVLAISHWWVILRHRKAGHRPQMSRHVFMLLLTAAGMLAIILMMPMSDSTRGQVLSLVGLVVTGVLGLSSTSFVANAMAGLMLRVVKTIDLGDFIEVGNQFGRVTERGLFHTEIQTENRDLTTFPNLHLVTNPVTVVRSSGTIVFAELSLGYDVPWQEIESLLVAAAKKSGLEEPFVQVRDLGDYSVLYRISGFLPEVKHLLTERSNLRKHVMDELHMNGVEIVSPAFMNQRQIAPGEKMIPRVERVRSRKNDSIPEEIIFDKADEAERGKKLQEAKRQLESEIAALEEERKTADEKRRIHIDHRIERLHKTLSALLHDNA
ncbi:MAG: mechanosensitive ion channel [Gammaproteobacteria bacterium]|nr:MAG: mechanosensitive ion channel [Gammaproteobacteria bacterium]